MRRNFPPEILVEILGSALPSKMDENGREQFQHIRSVCPEWRSLSFRTPEFWSYLHVDISSGDDLDEQIFDLMSQWFERSGTSCPLSLHYQDDWNWGTMEEGRAMRRLLQRYQPRWKSLSISTDPEWLFCSVHSLPSKGWSSLHTLVIWMEDLDGRDEAVSPHSNPITLTSRSLQGMPCLRRLEINDSTDFMDQFRDTDAIGPDKILELRLDISGFWIGYYNLLVGYKSLLHLELEIGYYQDPLGDFHGTDLPHLIFPSLLSLSIQGDAAPVLWWFTTRSLTHLAIQPFSYGPDSISIDFESLEGFLKRCSDNLTSIEVTDYAQDLPSSRILPSLSSRASLTKLALKRWPYLTFDDSVVKGLGSEFLPALSELTVSVGPEEETREIRGDEHTLYQRLESLRSFLAYRETEGYAALKTLTIRRVVEEFDFPYALFEGIELGKLRVMIPFSSEDKGR